jgi:hypothetical protein
MYLREYLFDYCRYAIFCASIAYTSDGQQHQLHIKKEPKPFGYCTSVICSDGFQFLNGAQHQLGFCSLCILALFLAFDHFTMMSKVVG